jgi:hypothetical protein
VAPGDVPVEADVHERKAVDRSAHGVIATRDREVHRIETLDAVPREVWVAQQGASAAGQIAAEGHRRCCQNVRG